MTLSAGDGSGSGVAATEYSLDGGAWTAYAGPFAVTSFGPHTLRFRSSDRAGNVEDARSVSWGAFTAAEQLAALSDLVGTFGLDRRLTAELRATLGLARVLVGAPRLSCLAVNAFLADVMREATETGADLTVAQARMLLSANQVLLTLGCQAAGSPRPGIEHDLLGMVGTINGFGLRRSVAADLKDGIREIGVRVVSGSSLACKSVKELRRTISEYDGRRNGLTRAEASELRTDLAAIADALDCP